MRIKVHVSLAAALYVAPCIAAAQVASVNPPLGMVAGAYSFDLSDGEPISWFLEFSEQLKLTPDQKTSLIAIRRRLRGENERFMERLDSTAQAVGLTLGERTARITGDERQALERFNKVTQPTRDSIRVNNEIARSEALTLLTSVQTVRLDSLMTVLKRGRGLVRRGRGAGGGGS